MSHPSNTDHSHTLISLIRDCDAVLVPAGTPVLLPEGTEVTITQRLGGNITVNIYGNLAQINAKDADALGIDIEPVDLCANIDINAPLEAQVWQQLRSCYDPEIPVNIVELGLIYDCQLHTPSEEDFLKHETDPNAPPVNVEDQKIVYVTMTLTAPGCGFGPTLIAEIEAKLRALPGVFDTRIELVFDPPWDQSRLSDEARLQLNLF